MIDSELQDAWAPAGALDRGQASVVIRSPPRRSAHGKEEGMGGIVALGAACAGLLYFLVRRIMIQRRRTAPRTTAKRAVTAIRWTPRPSTAGRYGLGSRTRGRGFKSRRPAQLPAQIDPDQPYPFGHGRPLRTEPGRCRDRRDGAGVRRAIREHPDLGELYIGARRAWLAAKEADDNTGLAEAHARIEAAIDLAEAYRGHPYTDRERDTVRYLARARGRRQ